jgi:hypothetical protein
MSAIGSAAGLGLDLSIGGGADRLRIVNDGYAAGAAIQPLGAIGFGRPVRRTPGEFSCIQSHTR